MVSIKIYQAFFPFILGSFLCQPLSIVFGNQVIEHKTAHY